MRQERTVQVSIFDLFADHEIGRDPSGGGGSAPTRRQGDRARGPAGRVGRALRPSQATSSAELRGVGVSSRGLGLVSRLRPAAAVVDTEEVGAAQDDQRHPGRDLGGDQSRRADQRASGEDRDRQGRAVRQHGHRRAHARAERQQSSLGCGACAGEAVAGGRRPGQGPPMARPPARGQEARARSNTPAIG